MDRDMLRQPPRNVRDTILSRALILKTLLSAATIISGTLFVFWKEVSHVPHRLTLGLDGPCPVRGETRRQMENLGPPEGTGTRNTGKGGPGAGRSYRLPGGHRPVGGRPARRQPGVNRWRLTTDAGSLLEGT